MQQSQNSVLFQTGTSGDKLIVNALTSSPGMRSNDVR